MAHAYVLMLSRSNLPRSLCKVTLGITLMVGSRQGRSAAGTSKLIAAKGKCEQIYDLTQTLQFENEARKTVGRLMEGDAVRRLN